MVITQTLNSRRLCNVFRVSHFVAHESGSWNQYRHATVMLPFTMSFSYKWLYGLLWIGIQGTSGKLDPGCLLRAHGVMKKRKQEKNLKRGGKANDIGIFNFSAFSQPGKLCTKRTLLLLKAGNPLLSSAMNSMAIHFVTSRIRLNAHFSVTNMATISRCKCGSCRRAGKRDSQILWRSCFHDYASFSFFFLRKKVCWPDPWQKWRNWSPLVTVIASQSLEKRLVRNNASDIAQWSLEQWTDNAPAILPTLPSIGESRTQSERYVIWRVGIETIVWDKG